MQTKNYSPPVDKLFTYGETERMDFRHWPNYAQELGITSEFVPELIRMATDKALWHEDAEYWASWAPVHAWRTLGQLRAREAVAPLLKLFATNINELIVDELYWIFGLIGLPSLPILREYWTNPDNYIFARTAAIESVTKIVKIYPDSYAECLETLTFELEKFEENDPTINAFLVAVLCDLKAVEAAPLIERAFASDRVDNDIQGDWDYVQVCLGLKSPADIPPKIPYLTDLETSNQKLNIASNLEIPSETSQRRFFSKTEAKAKRKQAEKSRKQNRKKKK